MIFGYVKIASTHLRSMASNVSICGVCEHRHVTKSSVVWCSECEEGLCEDCKEHHSFSKISRNHETVSINEYMKLPAEVLQIEQLCKIHNERYELLCRKHDCPCCKNCVETHNDCKDLTDIKNIIDYVKSSNAFIEIEHTLSETAENIKKVRIHHEEYLSSLADQKMTIEMEIEQIRTKINDRLDELQDSLKKEIHSVEQRESSKIRQLVVSLKEEEQEIYEYQANIENIKKYASDFQSYFAMKQIESNMALGDNRIQSIIRSKNADQIIISCTIDTLLQQFSDNIEKFGEVVVCSNPCDIFIPNRKNKQAQVIVDPPKERFDNVSLKLKQTIQTQLPNVRGCSFLPGGRMIFSCYDSGKVCVVKPDGLIDFELDNIGPTYDVVYVGDTLVAVTSGRTAGSRRINIIDLETRRMHKCLVVNSSNDGVAYIDGKLIYCARDEGLKVMNIRDGYINSIQISNMSSDAHIAALGEKLFYTNKYNNSVICCDLNGNTMWSFTESSVLEGPLGITVDNDGNVYVVGAWSKNLIVISTDGQRHRQLLSEKAGLNLPSVVHYDRLNNKLLVANYTKDAFVYDVE